MIEKLFGSRRGFLRYLRFWFLYSFLKMGQDPKKIPARVDRFVFVCKGNICRSPFAEQVFKTLSPKESTSFGLDTTSGKPAHLPIVTIASDLGIDLSVHQTIDWTDFIPKEFDLYICVEPDHSNFLRDLLPDANIVLLGSFNVRPKYYIHDPFNTINAYRRRCLANIVEAVTNLVDSTGSRRI